MGPAITGLVGDVGGTNARFALAHAADGRVWLGATSTLPAADYAEGKDAVRAFLDGIAAGERPKIAVIAAAGPVNDGAVSFTNHSAWRFDEHDLAQACDFETVRLINDFTAQALAIDHLGARDVHRIGPARQPLADATAAILGPGTGFGAAARIQDGAGVAIMTGEGGHIGFAPSDDTEIEIVRIMMKQYGRVSVERLLSGPGLLGLYQALAKIGGAPAVCDHPDAVTRAALGGDDLARAALSRFCAILGATAGDFALAVGARAGVYIAGGIAPAILDFLETSPFRDRFEAKGRMSDYVKAIPTLVVTAPYVAMVGAASLLPTLGRGA